MNIKDKEVEVGYCSLVKKLRIVIDVLVFVDLCFSVAGGVFKRMLHEDEESLCFLPDILFGCGGVALVLAFVLVVIVNIIERRKHC